MKSHFVDMARYNAWANRRLYAGAERLSEYLYRKDVGAFFGSLHATLNHLLVTDRIWMHRLTGTGDSPNNLRAILHGSLPELATARQNEDARIAEYIEGLRDEEIGETISYSTTKGVPQKNRLAGLLTHLFNHQTHHRGQAHCILSLLGDREPPPLDFLVMLRENS